MSGPASLFLFAASVFTLSCLLAVPVPYMAPVAKNFGIQILSPPQNSNSLITSSNLFASRTVHMYIDRSSAKAAWFHWGVLLIPCVISVASSKRRRALRNKSKRRGERTDPCTVPASSCIGAGTSRAHLYFHPRLAVDLRGNPRLGPLDLWGLPRGRSVLLS